MGVEGEVFGAEEQTCHARTCSRDRWGLDQTTGGFDQGQDPDLTDGQLGLAFAFGKGR